MTFDGFSFKANEFCDRWPGVKVKAQAPGPRILAKFVGLLFSFSFCPFIYKVWDIIFWSTGRRRGPTGSSQTLCCNSLVS